MHLSAVALYVSLLLSGHGLVVQDIKNGHGHRAHIGDTVSVIYVGKFRSGRVFYSNAKHGKPFYVTLGKHDVIPGWEQGLVGMKRGGHRRLVIPPSLAYGKEGAGGVIPPNATLIFDITMLSIKRGHN
jgi:FKBP-type peptidyl-prolyl cis-trans isomerase